jgi:hypothetical protein
MRAIKCLDQSILSLQKEMQEKIVEIFSFLNFTPLFIVLFVTSAVNIHKQHENLPF